MDGKKLQNDWALRRALEKVLQANGYVFLDCRRCGEMHRLFSRDELQYWYLCTDCLLQLTTDFVSDLRDDMVGRVKRVEVETRDNRPL